MPYSSQITITLLQRLIFVVKRYMFCTEGEIGITKVIQKRAKEKKLGARASYFAAI